MLAKRLGAILLSFAVKPTIFRACVPVSAFKMKKKHDAIEIQSAEMSYLSNFAVTEGSGGIGGNRKYLLIMSDTDLFSHQAERGAKRFLLLCKE